MNQRGRILIEGIVSLGVASIALASLVTLLATISHTAVRLSQSHQGVVATTKVYAAITAALRARERSRLPFAAQITQPPRLELTHGVAHPLAALSGATRPKEGSDILSVVELAQRCRGTVREAHASASSIVATVCDISCRIRRDEFKSYLLYAIDGARQVIGDLSAVSPSCVEVRGSVTSGLVGALTTFTSAPIVFAPVEREYSLFVDANDTFRIASHVGRNIVENQPITQGVASLAVSSARDARGVITFKVAVRPRQGRALESFIIPRLSERQIWNEVLP